MKLWQLRPKSKGRLYPKTWNTKLPLSAAQIQCDRHWRHNCHTLCYEDQPLNVTDSSFIGVLINPYLDLLPLQFFPPSREQVVARRGQIRRIGWVIKTLEAQVGQFLLGCKCLVSRFLPGLAKDLSAPRYNQNKTKVVHDLHCSVIKRGDTIPNVCFYIKYLTKCKIRYLKKTVVPKW
jgi:hypothetical protein